MHAKSIWTIAMVTLGLIPMTPTLAQGAYSSDSQAQIDKALAAEKVNDYKGALALWYTLAKADLAEAQYHVGVAYHFGRGICRDDAKAFPWFAKAADWGFGEAYHYVAALYWNGEGVAQDRITAVQWMEKAAERGVSEGEIVDAYSLGAIYGSSDDIARDEEKAVYWYRKAAVAGFGAAQYELAKRYENGLGVTRDLVESFTWYGLVAQVDQGDDRADDLKAMQRVASNMTRAQRVEAKRRVAASTIVPFRPAPPQVMPRLSNGVCP